MECKWNTKMNPPIYIKYYPNEDFAEAVQRARRRYGDDKKFILIPARLWTRLVPKQRKEQNHEKIRSEVSN